jgi:beta-phosphoglucomutase-like phosphatase (HAD superfamily)
MLEAIIFDFDGVIADTEKLHLRAFQEVLGGRGIGLTAADYYARYLGLDDSGVLRALARDCGLAAGDKRLAAILEEKVARYGRLIAASPVLFDGVEERVREWSREVPLAIASGALRSEVEGILRRHDLLARFAAIVTAGDVTRGKPAPDPYLAALDRLNAAPAAAKVGKAEAPDAPPRRPGSAGGDIGRRPPASGRRRDRPIEAGRVVVIEDSRPGVASARAAGMRAVAVTTNCPAAQLAAADLIVASVGSLALATLRALVER